MLSKLYNGLLAEGKLMSFWVDGMEWVTGGDSEKRMELLKDYWGDFSRDTADLLDGYELFAIDAGGNPWLEEKTTGRAAFFPHDSTTPYPEPQYRSVEAAVMSQILKFAAEELEYLDMDEREVREVLNTSAEACEKYFPREWTDELRHLAEKPFEDDLLISDEELRGILAKLGL